MFLNSKLPSPAPDSTHPPTEWAPWALSPAVIRPLRQTNRSHAHSADVNGWNYTSTSPYAIMAWIGTILLYSTTLSINRFWKFRQVLLKHTENKMVKYTRSFLSGFKYYWVWMVMELMVAFRNFAKAPKSGGLLWVRWITILQTKRQNEPGETIEDISGYVRPKRVNKWPNSMIARLLLLLFLFLLLFNVSFP
jgi:hypothetical protein